MVARDDLGCAYRARWLPADVAGISVSVFAFILDTSHSCYTGDLPLHQQALRIAHAAGELGTNRDYLFRTRGALTANNLEELSTDVTALRS